MNNLVGNTYGDIEVVSLVDTNKYGNNKYLCKCKCGKMRYLWQNKIISVYKGNVPCKCIKNTIIKHKDYAEIHIKDKICLVDIEDLPKIMFHSWCLNTQGYAIATINRKITLMHRLILNTNMDIDHANHNVLDNRKQNLRCCTRSQNNSNKSKQRNTTSKYLGVSFCPIKNKWRVQITHKYQNIFIGYFDSEEEGAKAYNKYALELKGKFANLNKI